MRIIFALSIALSFVACKKADEQKSVPASTSPTGAGASVAADGTRRVPIEVVGEGYKPDRIVGKPGEKLVLVFTRKAEGECYEELKAPDGKLFKLPLNKPTDVAVTVPMDGEVKFACGMGMLEGTIIADKG